MGKFFCEYCQVKLSHSSPSGRKQHDNGRRHIIAKIDYYKSKFAAHSTLDLILSPQFVPPSHIPAEIVYNLQKICSSNMLQAIIPNTHSKKYIASLRYHYKQRTGGEVNIKNEPYNSGQSKSYMYSTPYNTQKH